MRHGVTFKINGKAYHSSDFGMVLGPVTIPVAEPKTEYIEIEGASGSIDASEVFGLCYKDVAFDLDFTFTNYSPQEARDLRAALHGRRAQVTLYSDPEFYYDARLAVGETKGNGSVKTVSIKCTAKPFRYKQSKTRVKVRESKTLRILNASMPTVPAFTSNEAFAVTYAGETYSLEAGTRVVPDIIFDAGENEIGLQLTAPVTVEFQEGVL